MRALVAQCGMSSFSVVEDLDVIKQAGFGLLMVQVILAMHLLFLERGKEAFHDRIVPAVAFATHAAHDVAVHQIQPTLSRWDVSDVAGPRSVEPRDCCHLRLSVQQIPSNGKGVVGIRWSSPVVSLSFSAVHFNAEFQNFISTKNEAELNQLSLR